MKRIKLLIYLHEHGCLLIREGKRHSVIIEPLSKRVTTVPRHSDIQEFLAEKICKDLGIRSIRKQKKG